MKAWLILQEGPGAGYSYPLDPFRQPALSVGRSSACDIVVNDHRASRHHSDIRWNGRQWEVADRGSTNGTYVNGVRIHRPSELHPGDRVTVGETTMVLREHSALPAAPLQPPTIQQPVRAAQGHPMREPGPASQPQPAPPRGADHVLDRPGERVLSAAEESQRTSASRTVIFWLAQGLVAAAVICLAAGAFLPWFRVTGSLSRDMEPLIQGIANLVSSIVGEDLLSVVQDIDGLSGFGRFTLGIAVVSTVLLLVDIFLLRRSILPGFVYLVTSLVVTLLIAADLKNLHDLYDQIQSISLLFGIELADVIEAFGKFIEVEVTFLPGLYLTGAGLVLLFVGGIVRLVVALPSRGK